jgi:SNF2 family DNA or RNA helicase
VFLAVFRNPNFIHHDYLWYCAVYSQYREIYINQSELNKTNITKIHNVCKTVAYFTCLIRAHVYQNNPIDFKPAFLIKNNILHQSKNYKNHFENSNSEVCDLYWLYWSRWSCDIQFHKYAVHINDIWNVDRFYCMLTVTVIILMKESESERSYICVLRRPLH